LKGKGVEGSIIKREGVKHELFVFIIDSSIGSPKERGGGGVDSSKENDYFPLNFPLKDSGGRAEKANTKKMGA